MTTPDASNNFKLSIGDTLKEIYRFFGRRATSSYWRPSVVLSFFGSYGRPRSITVPGDSANQPPSGKYACCMFRPRSIFCLCCDLASTLSEPGVEVGIKDALIPNTRHLKYFFSTLLTTLFAVAVISVPIVIVIIFTLVINFAAGGKVKPPVDVQTVSVFVGIVAAVLFSCVFLRLAQWLSVIAIASPFKMLEAWRLGRGNSWRLFAIACGAAIIPAFLIGLYQLTPTNLDLLSIFSENPWIVIATLLGEYAVAYITLAFSVATLSVCYDRLLTRIANDPLFTLGAGPLSTVRCRPFETALSRLLRVRCKTAIVPRDF